MGYTHVELMPVTEHPFDGSWGYQVCGIFRADLRASGNAEGLYVLSWIRCHQHEHRGHSGLGPGRISPRTRSGLYEFDGGPLL